MNKYYIPILKLKQCEKNALLELPSEYHSKLKPYLKIQIRNKNSKTKKPSKSIDEYLESTSEEIKKLSFRQGFFIDAENLNEEEMTKDGLNPHVHFYNLLQYKNIKFIPVLKSDSTLSTISIIKKLNCSNGIAIIINYNELSNLQTLIDNFKTLDIDLNNTFLFIDFKYIDELPTIDSEMLNNLNKTNIWDNFSQIILCSSSFPLDFSQINLNSIGYIKKLEQDLYCNLAPEINYDQLKIMFADYTCINPNQLADFDFTRDRFASIRYTTEKNYIILRGNVLKSGTYDQYITLAEKLIDLKDYRGKDYSFGDLYIYNVSKSNVSSGSPTTWLQAAINHHLKCTIDELSSSSYF